jgi:hypothetical protein
MKSKTRYAKLIGAWLCLALMAVAGAAALGQTGGSTAHLAEANTLVNILDKNNNKYDDDGISNSFINWDGSEAWTNCATFITLLLKHTYGWTDADFVNWWQSSSPTAARYHDQIAAQNRFAQVLYRSQILPGDLIAIEYPAGSAVTGHVMLVAGPPTLRSPGTNPIIAGTLQYEVPVIDSSSSYHGPTDTRHPNNGGVPGGIGRGVFRLYVDAGDQIVGYTWSTYSNSTYYNQSQRHLVVGRLW